MTLCDGQISLIKNGMIKLYCMINPYTKFGFIKGLLVYTSLLLAANANSQTQPNENYLLIRFERLYDNTNQKVFYSINAERGCDKASTIYSLLKYDAKKNAENISGKFYSDAKNTGDSLYNYFLSPTEGLNYLAQLEWKLVSVFAEVSSGFTTERASGDLVPITTVASKPVFCFMK